MKLLHEQLVEQLHSMGWTEIRPIQIDAIRCGLMTNEHMLIIAQTAAGKTEAAFLPILSHILSSGNSGLRAMYVGPLKALINDQFRRLESLCENLNVPVHKWHGDVSQNKKNSFVADASGILLITPESLESMFVNRAQSIPIVFSSLDFVVVDEVHAFIGTERGAHLISLLGRLKRRSGRSPRIIGLSATIGEPELAKRWFFRADSEQVKTIFDDNGDKEIQLQIRGYLDPEGHADESKAESIPSEVVPDKVADDIFKHHYGSTCLVFANSRANVEFYADHLRRKAEKRNLPNRFVVHHGSLSKTVREEAEETLKSQSPTVALCSSTLELGIDIGNIVSVGQVGSPWSVSSLRQRLGRSGRGEGEPSKIRIYIRQTELSADDSIPRRLLPELIQAISMVELVLKQWCEPPEITKLHGSTLVHQILSLIAETGGASAAKIFRELVTEGPFSNIDSALFQRILVGLGQSELVEQIDDGTLILGREGERIVRSFDFYSAFVTTEELRVVCEGRTVGLLPTRFPPIVGGYIILAGRRWLVIESDTKRRELLVTPSAGGKVPIFDGGGGGSIHELIRKTMRQVLVGQDDFVYLDPGARDMLALARSAAAQCSLATQSMICEGENLHWFTWTSSKVNRTLQAVVQKFLSPKADNFGIGITVPNVQMPEMIDALERFLVSDTTEEELTSKFPIMAVEKFDQYLQDDVQRNLFARNNLDVMAAKSFVYDALEVLYREKIAVNSRKSVRIRYLTKSRHKLALKCPTKLFYNGKADKYADSSVDDPFLLALARGGFQVGALAQCYYPDGIKVDELNHEAALQKTRELLRKDVVTIFEPAFLFGTMFVRVDILVKNGNHVRLLEVKSKSFDPTDECPFYDRTLLKKGRFKIKNDYATHIYDVAFQTLVVRQAHPDWNVSSFLVLADKSKQATVEGLNQFFLLGNDASGRTTVTVRPELKRWDLGEQILCEVNVDDVISTILEDRDEGRPATDRVNGLPFAQEARHLAKMYAIDQRVPWRPSKQCRKCEFRVEAARPLKSGFAECWTKEAHARPSDVVQPFVFDVWNFRKSEELIKNRKFFIRDLTKEDIVPVPSTEELGLSASERQWVQVDFEQRRRSSCYIDVPGLHSVFRKFKYPLNFIDFETTMVAIPFNSGRRPYEQIAFQFSHHRLYQDGRIEHSGQYLCAEKGKFPNFDFVRALKESLESDDGTIFRYSHHENTVLCQIRDQLSLSSEPDRIELISWIETVTKSGKGASPGWCGSRCMFDLCDLVQRFYYNPATKGSNSIKYVLPAVLNDSPGFSERFERPIYGSSLGVKSINFKDWIWIQREGGKVVDPYSLLPKVYQNLTPEELDKIMCGNDELANGGSAMTAYSMMQFAEISDVQREALKQALLKYCELDTFAMVLLILYWQEFVTGARAPAGA